MVCGYSINQLNSDFEEARLSDVKHEIVGYLSSLDYNGYRLVLGGKKNIEDFIIIAQMMI